MVIEFFGVLKIGDWIFSYMHPVDYWKAHPSYVLCEAIFIFGAITMIIHGVCVCEHQTPKTLNIEAKSAVFYSIWLIFFVFYLLAFKEGGRWPWLFFAAMGHGFFVEFMAYFAPFIENFWHAQGIVTLFDRRMTLYIAFLCKF